MNYETPELIDLGVAEEIVLGCKKPNLSDANGTGDGHEVVDEDVE
jgi:hypothetical protein